MEVQLWVWRETCVNRKPVPLGKTEALLLQNIEMLIGIHTQLFCLFVLLLI